MTLLEVWSNSSWTIGLWNALADLEIDTFSENIQVKFRVMMGILNVMSAVKKICIDINTSIDVLDANMIDAMSVLWSSSISSTVNTSWSQKMIWCILIFQTTTSNTPIALALSAKRAAKKSSTSEMDKVFVVWNALLKRYLSFTEHIVNMILK